MAYGSPAPSFHADEFCTGSDAGELARVGGGLAAEDACGAHPHHEEAAPQWSGWRASGSESAFRLLIILVIMTMQFGRINAFNEMRACLKY
jgi:hypothetical protein